MACLQVIDYGIRDMGETGKAQGAIQRGVPASQAWPVCRSLIMGYGIWVKQGRHKVPSKGVFQQLMHGMFADHSIWYCMACLQIIDYGIWVKPGRDKVPSKGVFQHLKHGLFADH